MKKHKYNARWVNAVDLRTNLDVSFEATSDYHAKKVADGLAREHGRTNSPRTIVRTGVGVIENIRTGISGG